MERGVRLSRRFHRKPRFCIFPGYNWCGPGCNGPGPPINELDAACKAHDKCYQRGRCACECDQEFLCRLRRLCDKIDPCTQEGRHTRFLYRYMKLQTLITCKLNRF
nr:phospholipase [Sporosarcina sp. HYO08]